MRSQIAEAIGLKHSSVAVLLTNERPAGATQFKQGSMGCVASMMMVATKGRCAVFDRKTFGCPGGGTGLGFGDCYSGFPIERLLSTGGKAELANGGTFDMHEGERFHANPEISSQWVRAFPFRNVATEYVVFKPLEQVPEEEQVAVVVMLVNPDQLSALVTLSGFRTGAIDTAIAPWGASCQSIVYAYVEGEQPRPRGVIGFFDISQRGKIAPDLLSYTMPYQLFLRMEADVEDSFLRTDAWRKLRERIDSNPNPPKGERQ